MVSAFKDLIEDPPTIKTPFVCKLAEFMDYDEENDHVTCLLEDDQGNKCIGFFYKKYAELLRKAIIKRRIPFIITVIHGNVKDLGGTFIFEVYHVVFEKNFLINSSALSAHSYCPAQTYFRYHINAEGDLNANLLYGVLLHDYLGIIFDEPGLLKMNPEDPSLSDLVKKSYMKAIHWNWKLLTAIGVREDDVFKAFMTTSYERELEFVKYEIDALTATEDEYVFENETMIRSKNFGVQGRIDRLIWNQTKNQFTLIETKTGKSSASSKQTAQFQLVSYSIMLQEYFDETLEELILEYPRNEIDERLYVVDFDENLFFKLMEMRNQIWATSVGVRPEFGPFLHCSRCWNKEICSFYCLRNFLTNHCNTCEGCKFKTLLRNESTFEEFLRSNVYYDWFFQFLEREYQENLRLRSEINLDAAEREKIGNCLANMVIDDMMHSTVEGESDDEQIQMLHVLLRKDEASELLNTGTDLSGTRLNKGDFVLLTQQDYKPLTVRSYKGTIADISDTVVTLEMNIDLEEDLGKYPTKTQFRIDSTVSNRMLNMERSALDQFLRRPYMQEFEKTKKIRDILINNPKNNEETDEEGAMQTVNVVLNKIKQDLGKKGFNKQQIRAIIKSLNTEDLLLIQGPPGTGKTTAIAELVYQLTKYLSLRNKADQTTDVNEKNPGMSKKDEESDNLDEEIKKFDFEIKPLKKQILVSAFTNRAVDNIVEKLVEDRPELQIIRVGNTASMTATARTCSLQSACEISIKDSENEKKVVYSPAKARKALEDADIIASTCLGCGNQIFKHISFDYVIIDEAGQLIEPAALIPMMKADRVILIGDDKQLPPISTDMENPKFNKDFFAQKNYLRDPNKINHLISASEISIAKRRQVWDMTLSKIRLKRDDTLSTSIFQRLRRILGTTDRYTAFQQQYRMNQKISDFVSEIFYENKIVPGISQGKNIGERTIQDFFKEKGLSTGLIGRCENSLIQFLFDADHPLIFLDTKVLDPKDSKLEQRYEEIGSRFNTEEADIIANAIVEFFRVLLSSDETDIERISSEISKDIGVITPYRAQVRLIRQKIRSFLNDHDGIMNTLSDNIMVNTVDKFQGREAEIIIISLVDSNPARELSILHEEVRRINVSITRAKTKVILIGNSLMFGEKEKTDAQDGKMAQPKYKHPKNLVDFIHQAEKQQEQSEFEMKNDIYAVLRAFVDFAKTNNGYRILSKRDL
mgnify:CR=1 FL=1